MTKLQFIYFVIATVVVATALILTLAYRPYIAKNNINDFGFADTIGSLASVISFCFFTWSFKNYTQKEKNKHILYATIGYAIIWEMLGLIGIYGTFDWKDIIAGFISGALTFIIKELLDKPKRYQIERK